MHYCTYLRQKVDTTMVSLFQQNWYSEIPMVMDADDKSNERRCLMSEGLVASTNTKAIQCCHALLDISTVDHVNIGCSTSWFLRQCALICPSSIDTDHWFITKSTSATRPYSPCLSLVLGCALHTRINKYPSIGAFAFFDKIWKKKLQIRSYLCLF